MSSPLARKLEERWQYNRPENRRRRLSERYALEERFQEVRDTRILKDYRKCDFARIVREVAKKHGITSAEILSKPKSRYAALTDARHEAYYAVAVGVAHSLHKTAEMFDRDHTSIRYGLRKHCERNGIPIPVFGIFNTEKGKTNASVRFRAG